MNEWSVAALALLAGLVPCGVVCLRGDPLSRLVGLEMAGEHDPGKRRVWLFAVDGQVVRDALYLPAR